jgi:glycosyltransferase involved in cell wall biosynthesis
MHFLSRLGTSASSKLYLLALHLISEATDHYQGSSACFAGYNCNQSSIGTALIQVSRVATLELAPLPTAPLYISLGQHEFTPDLVPSSEEDAKILNELRFLFVASVDMRWNVSQIAERGQEPQRLCTKRGVEFLCSLSEAQRLCVVPGAIHLADDSCVDPSADINRLLMDRVLGFRDSGAKYPVDEAAVKASLTCSAQDAKKLAICVCVRNEEETIAEFIQWHRLLGVGHFYVYNDASIDRTPDILGNFSKDVVTIINTQWGNGSNVQYSAFTDCAHKHGHKHEWLGFLDADEFVQPLEGGKGDKDVCLFPFLQGMQEGNASSVQLNWAMGFSDELSFEAVGEKTALEQIGFDGLPNYHTKSFCRPQCIDGFDNPHYCNLKATPGTSCKDESLNTDGRNIQLPNRATQDPPAMTRFRVAHYFRRPFQGWLGKRMRGRATTRKAHEPFGLARVFSSWQFEKSWIVEALNKTGWWPNKSSRDDLNQRLNEKLKAMVVRRA